MGSNSVLCLQLAEALAEADVALFPNRGEGGTNLMAMQAMASGVPTVLSANSGMDVSVVHWLRNLICVVFCCAFVVGLRASEWNAYLNE